MVTYFTTAEATIKAANQAKSENFETYIEERSYQCDCGESSAYYLIDEKTLNTLQVFVECEACHFQYE